MSEWLKNLRPGGKSSNAHDPSRRNAIKNIALGTAAIGLAGAGLHEILNRPKNIAYAEDAYDAPQQQLLQDGEGFALEKLPAKTPDILVVDGYRSAGNWTVETMVATDDVYLNQAFLKDVTQLRFRRSSSYEDETQPEEGGVIAEHDYTLELLDKSGQPLGNINYGTVQDNINGDGLGEIHDKFPNIHFFNSRGEVIDFKISGADLITKLPRAQLLSRDIGPEDSPETAREVPPATVSPENLQELFEPYAAMRDRAKRDGKFEKTFATDTKPVPLTKARFEPLAGVEGELNPARLGGLAAELNAPKLEKLKGHSL